MFFIFVRILEHIAGRLPVIFSDLEKFSGNPDLAAISESFIDWEIAIPA